MSVSGEWPGQISTGDIYWSCFLNNRVSLKMGDFFHLANEDQNGEKMFFFGFVGIIP